MFDLYVDPIVDRVVPEIKKVLKIDPIDEPLLRYVFEDKRYQTIKAFGANLMLPNVEVLLATKVNSVLKRQKDHKRTKDVADIYALIWHSGIKTPALRRKLFEVLDEKIVANILSQLNDKDFEEAAAALGLSNDEISRVIKSLIPTLINSRTMDENNELEKEPKTEETRWRIPFNTSYDSFMMIVKALYKLHADTKRVTLDDVQSITQMNKNTLSVNLLFLKSINVVEGEGAIGYKLTEMGSRYAKAHVGNDQEGIRKASLEFIEKSHLQSLQHYIELHKDVKPRQLYDYIKAEGRFADGTGPTGLSTPWSGGARILLRIFKDAGILPEDFEIDVKSAPERGSEGRLGPAPRTATPKPKPSSQSNQQQQRSAKDDSSNYSHSASEVQPGFLGRLAVKGVGVIDINDEDTFRLAESFLQILKRKIESRKTDKNEKQDE